MCVKQRNSERVNEWNIPETTGTGGVKGARAGIRGLGFSSWAWHSMGAWHWVSHCLSETHILHLLDKNSDIGLPLTHRGGTGYLWSLKKNTLLYKLL